MNSEVPEDVNENALLFEKSLTSYCKLNVDDSICELVRKSDEILDFLDTPQRSNFDMEETYVPISKEKKANSEDVKTAFNRTVNLLILTIGLSFIFLVIILLGLRIVSFTTVLFFVIGIIMILYSLDIYIKYTNSNFL